MNDMIAATLRDVQINWSPADVRSKIYQLQEVMKTLPSRLDDCPVEHLFSPGVYCRKMFIPKGIVIIGKLHRHAHPNIISQGLVSVATEFGSEQIAAYAMFTSKVGTKRAVVALADTIWTTVHSNPDNITDLIELEAMVIAEDYSELGMESPSKGVLQ